MLVQMFSPENTKVVKSADDRKTGAVTSTTLDATQEYLSDLEDRDNQCTIDEARRNSMQDSSGLRPRMFTLSC